ncbi:MAG: hypothetical protein J6S38_04545 [Erysipelotrichaceae bacterium]|nr:hypothetical protein [Erysipelotrichaceae bacterium]MBP5280578.1 hypothetical protein [Erysipelotrichaceae bacterium]
MIKNDFEKLNSDDWLKKEIEREKRVSAWDFDEGRRVRSEHEEDCDVRNNAFEHEVRHSRRMPVEARKIENRPRSQSSVWFVFDIMLLFFLVGFHTYMEARYGLYGFQGTGIPFLLLMLLNPFVIIYSIIRKRLLPNFYYLMVFVVTVAIELFWLAIRYRYLVFLFS